jgi:hypothetical protein
MEELTAKASLFFITVNAMLKHGAKKKIMHCLKL